MLASLLDKLNGFAPHSSPQNGGRKGKAFDTPPDPVGADRFGPATRMRLSAEAVSRLQDDATGPADTQAVGPASGGSEGVPPAGTHGSTAPSPLAPEPADAIRLPRATRPSADQLSRIHEIAARHLDDITGDGADRMMLDLRRAGLHPAQLAGAEPAAA